MTASPDSFVAPRSVLALPVALLAHQLEEWLLGFPEWSQAVLGEGIDSERFLVINTFGFVLLGVGAVAARISPAMAWFAVSFATLLGVNGLVHAAATLVFGAYSPGTASGLLVSVVVLRASRSRVSRPAFIAAVAAGVLVHAAVTLVALA